jgi:hypothetical protein
MYLTASTIYDPKTLTGTSDVIGTLSLLKVKVKLPRNRHEGSEGLEV